MDFEMHYFPPSIFLADLEMQTSLSKNKPLKDICPRAYSLNFTVRL